MVKKSISRRIQIDLAKKLTFAERGDFMERAREAGCSAEEYFLNLIVDRRDDCSTSSNSELNSGSIKGVDGASHDGEQERDSSAG